MLTKYFLFIIQLYHADLPIFWQNMSHLESGSVVWVRLGQAWWPGTITTVAKCPPDFVQAIRKTPIAIVKFFHENE